MLVWVGILLVLSSAALLARFTLRAPARARFPLHGWLGLVGVAAAEILLWRRTPVLTTFFTPVIWTVYIMAADGAVVRLTGRSPAGEKLRFWSLWLLSIPGWLTFEAYNFAIKNWIYTGVTRHFWEYLLGGMWAIGAIYPGIFVTAEIIFQGGWKNMRCRPILYSRRGRILWTALGAFLCLLPLFCPESWDPYMGAAVWLGFIFLVDPICYALDWPSLLRDLEQGLPGRFWSLLLAGGFCGFFWEFWNYWAGDRWWYVFPILPHARIFAMPFPGFFGFPPFALECFTMAVFASWLLLPRRLRPTQWFQD